MNPPVIRRRGLLLILASPSGAGKTTITRRLVAGDPTLALSVSVTTRPQRPGEVDGQDYHFIDRTRFEAMIEGGELLEHAIVFGHGYGTPRGPIEAAIAAGRDVVGDVDWQGARQLSRNLPDDLVKIFVLPPSLAALEQRLRARAQDSPAVVAARLSKSAEETSHWPECDYVIVNTDIEDSAAKVAAILAAERSRRSRQIGLADFVNHLFAG